MTKKIINRAIKHLNLKIEGARGDACFYFVDLKTDNVIDESTVYVCYLNQLSLEQWVKEAEFIKKRA